MKVPLTSGAYTAHSVIAAAQRCVNLFPEPGPKTATSAGTHVSETGEPSTTAHYPTPGTRLLGTIGSGPIRGIRQCTTGGVYVVSGDTLYLVDVTNWTGTALGTLTPGIKTPVSMQDNGLDMLVVDGMIAGWTVNLASNAFAAIDVSDGTFSGADKVDYLDTFFILNKPNTPQFYISGSLATTFDPLDFANKEAYSDLLVTVAVTHRILYLFGERTSEVWYDAGLASFSTTDATAASTFQFAPMQSLVFIDHGCAAKHSPATDHNRVFWLTKDRRGQGIVMMAEGETATRVSTFAIEAMIAGFERISDAIGFCYQLAGHSFYVLTFPHADWTGVYDITTGLWHQWAWIDSNGDEHRHRANCFWAVNDLGVVGDWQNGNLYALDNRVFTDNGQPIKRVRAFPHILNDGKRVFYRQFLADLETGNAPQVTVGTAAPAPALADLKLVEFQTPGVGAIVCATSDGGFPSTAFNYLLSSMWVCLPYEGSFGTNVTVDFPFFEAHPQSIANVVQITLYNAGTSFFDAAYQMPPRTVRAHILVSVNCVNQIVQVYINDAPITPTSGGFTAALSLLRGASGIFRVIGAGTVSGHASAIADLWSSHTPAFVDLNIESNRRKFITRDLNPVYLGPTGTEPTGTQPPVYLTIPTGGVATDFRTNYGTGGAFSGTFSSLTLGFQAAGVCTLPPPPPPPPAPPAPRNLISLRWSDDRGHSWGSPVTQDIGEAGEYRTSLQWQRLAYARDRCFELSWSVPMKTALQGAWIDVTPGDSTGGTQGGSASS